MGVVTIHGSREVQGESHGDPVNDRVPQVLWIATAFACVTARFGMGPLLSGYAAGSVVALVWAGMMDRADSVARENF